jgi:integrase
VGQLSPHSFADYLDVCRRLADVLGRTTIAKESTADDFMRLMANCETWGPVTRGNFVNRTRVVFKGGMDSGLLDNLPRYGPEFKRPSKKELRLDKAKKGPRIFEADEIRQMLVAAKQPLKSMIMLAINAGFGNADVGRLPLASLDLKTGWTNYYREKTGITRRCPLWPETIKSIQEWLCQRPKPVDSSLEARVFVTAVGGSWYKETGDNPVSKEMSKLLQRLNPRPACHRPYHGA